MKSGDENFKSATNAHCWVVLVVRGMLFLLAPIKQLNVQMGSYFGFFGDAS
jgi:hypothetical protein